MLSDGFAVILTLKQEPLADGSVDINLRIYPTEEQMHLPEGKYQKTKFRIPIILPILHLIKEGKNHQVRIFLEPTDQHKSKLSLHIPKRGLITR